MSRCCPRPGWEQLLRIRSATVSSQFRINFFKGNVQISLLLDSQLLSNQNLHCRRCATLSDGPTERHAVASGDWLRFRQSLLCLISSNLVGLATYVIAFCGTCGARISTTRRIHLSSFNILFEMWDGARGPI